MDVKEQLKTYIAKIFGPMVGEKLLTLNLQKLGATNLNNMDLKQQSEIMEKVLKNIFEKHMKGKNLDKILNEMKMNFAIDNATPNISKMINQPDIQFKIKEQKEIGKDEIPTFFEPIDKDNTIVITITFHGDLNAIIFLFLDKSISLDIANVITKLMTGKDAGSKELDDVTKNSINEFINISLSEVLKLYNTIATKDIKFVLDITNIDKYDSFNLEIQQNIQTDESIKKLSLIDLELKLKINSLKGKAILIQ